MPSRVDLHGFLFSDQPEQEYYRSISKERARQLGQYFTPYAVARFMASWVRLAPRLRRVMDPAVGLGIFFRALLDVCPDYSGTFHGFDVDARALDQLRRLLAEKLAGRMSLTSGDFLEVEDGRKYDGILCNPPYLRYKAIHDREKLIRKLATVSDVNLDRLSNLYAFFILRSAQALAPHGRAAILVPSDFLYSGFGAPIKEFLLDSGLLKYILLFAEEDSLFEDSTTTSCVLLLDHTNDGKLPIFITVKSAADLEILAGDIRCLEQSPVPLSVVKPGEISAGEKWSVYFRGAQAGVAYRCTVPFSRVARVMRGIASGDNHFFTFSRPKIDRSGIPPEYFLPCLTRASQATRPFFCLEDFRMLEASGKPVFLLDASLEPDHPAVKAYLDLGKRNGSHMRFLTRNRSPWYRLEQRPPAPILATTFNRGNLRFVRNEAAVRNLTCYHSIYLQPGFESRADLLMAYLLTPLAHTLIRPNRRIYGDGLIKYEPNDLNTAQIADLTALPEAHADAALTLYAAYRRSHLSGDPDESLIDRLERLFHNWMQPV